MRLKVILRSAPYLVSVILSFVPPVLCQVKDEKPNSDKPAAGQTWSSLSDFHCIKGRAADRDDISKGNAIFVLEQDGVPIGHAVSLALPQYAFYFKGPKGAKIPCIIIQAEELNGVQIFGCRVNQSNSEFVDVSNNFQLLGFHPSQGQRR